MIDPLWSDERIAQEVKMRCRHKSDKDAWEFVAMRMRDEYEAERAKLQEAAECIADLIQWLADDHEGES